jgi:hypothetical protein
MDNMEKLYTASEFAEMMGVHPETVKLWHRKGKVRAVKIGERWLRFPESEINRIMGVENAVCTTQ